MKNKKLTLPFVLNGKPFEPNAWTYKKHEEVLKEVAEYEKINKDASKDELDKYYRTVLILKGLKEVDANVKSEDLDTLHPDDLIALFAAIYLHGKRGIYADDDSFRKKEDKNKQD